jgi:hypothetical protein
MSVIAVKNVIHKYTETNINILYEPTYSLFDYIIYNLPFNFFTTKPYIIDKSNVVYVRDLSLFSYDMLFSHNEPDTTLATKLHIPSVRYVHTYALEEAQSSPNVFTILENATDVNVPSFYSVSMPLLNIEQNTKTHKTALINSSPAGLDPKIVEFFGNQIPDLHIIDHTNNLLNISQYKTIIDLYPTNQTNMLYALNNNVHYLTTTQKNTIKYAEKYNNVHHASTVLDLIQKNTECLETYSENSFSEVKNSLSSNWHDQMTNILSSIKSIGFYL